MYEIQMWLRELGLGAINLDVLKIAFTHSSFKGMGYDVEDNERLEFLGDAVLDLILAEMLYNDEDLSESEMTELRKNYVRNDQLPDIFDNLQMERFIRTANKFPLTKNVKAGFVEAFFGAIFIEEGYDTCYDLWITIIKKINSSLQYYNFPPPLKNAKSILQEFCQSHLFGNPEYHLEDKFGPDHDLTFRVELIIMPGNSKKEYESVFETTIAEHPYVWAMGEGKRKKEAEMDAARKMCKTIGLLYSDE